MNNLIHVDFVRSARKAVPKPKERRTKAELLEELSQLEQALDENRVLRDQVRRLEYKLTQDPDELARALNDSLRLTREREAELREARQEISDLEDELEGTTDGRVEDLEAERDDAIERAEWLEDLVKALVPLAARFDLVETRYQLQRFTQTEPDGVDAPLWRAEIEVLAP